MQQAKEQGLLVGNKGNSGANLGRLGFVGESGERGANQGRLGQVVLRAGFLSAKTREG